MKRLLLALLLPIVGTITAAPAPPYNSGFAQVKAHRATAVYLCANGKSVVYHSSRTCAAMRRCSHTVRVVSVSEATATGHRKCMKCY
ncbi:hypothetical protein GCM10028824_36730 [Hymenobacter segetis]|uniref:Uncharacterized protein n=1 Tax=Hymenobacter segetis TaxID=2025509 RepID=A0ABU9LVZ5_9BACT